MATITIGQEKAKELMEQNRYAEAAVRYERYLRKNTDDSQAYESLAEAYRYLREFKKAELNYEKADLFGGLSEEGFVNYGQMLIKNGNPIKAKFQFQRYLKAQPNSFIVRLMLQSIDQVTSWSKTPKSFIVNELHGFNTEFSEFCPVAWKNGIAFTTERNIDHVNENTSAATNNPYLSVYYSSFKDSAGLKTSAARYFLTRLNDDFHIGPIALDSIHNVAYFTQVEPGRKGQNVQRLKTYKAQIINDKRLGKPTLLPFCSDSFSVAHPTITPDGKTMFFASDKPGGKGKMDLYKSERVDAVWQEPSILKGKINSTLNEVFPFAKSDSVIYFSSDGHEGYGGMDIYESKLVNGEWTEPTNLRAPINSEGDDFGITFVNNNKGYFSSERIGGVGRDDIYQFVKIADPDDTVRVEVAGVFNFSPLPPDGLTLRLLDENDNVIEVVQTDSLGNFTFVGLPENKEYTIEVDGLTDEQLAESSIYLKDDAGQNALLLDRIEDRRFTFNSLPPDQISSFAHMEENDREIGHYEIFGQIFNNLPIDEVAGISIIIMDDSGNVIDEVTTDEFGMFNFSDLDKSQIYTVTLATPDSIIYLSSVYYQDGTLHKVENTENSLFNLQRLIIARTIAKKSTHPAIGYIEYEGNPVVDARLLMIDSTSKYMRAVESDSSGKFDFGKILTTSKFQIIVEDSLASLPGQLNIYFINDKGDRIIYAREQTKTLYAFKSLSPDGYQFGYSVAEDSDLDDYGVYGQVFMVLPGDYNDQLLIVAVDEFGRVIETVLTDTQGLFDFQKLHIDQHYSFILAEEDQAKLKVKLYSSQGEFVEELRLDEMANYVYEKLNSEQRERFIMLEEDITYFNPDKVSGMIYKTLQGDYHKQIWTYALDDNGNVIDSARTDADGNFAFKNIDRETDFKFKVDDEEDTELQVVFFNYNHEFDGLVKLDSNNTFTYSKIILEAASELGLDEEEDESKGLTGYAFNKLTGDNNAGMKLYALDDDGNIIEVAVIDENGKFNFEKLSPDGDYVLKFEDESQDITLSILDENGNQNELEKGPTGWNYDKLAREKFAMALEIVEDGSLDFDAHLNDGPLTSSNNTLYYEYREFELTSDDKELLRSLARALNADDGRILKINSHVDSSEPIGDYSFSAMRSVTIVNYLYERGIYPDRIRVENWESKKMAVDCGTGIPCDKADRAQNQRVELSVIDIKSLQKDPDRLIFYEFNRWNLRPPGQAVVNELIGFLKNNPEHTVKLDGYSDTWGSTTSNEKVGELRTQNIQTILINSGIDASRITTENHGERIPTGDCMLYYPCPVSEREQNRRVEIRLFSN